MRPQAFYALIGLLFIVAGALMFNQSFTRNPDNRGVSKSAFKLDSSSFAEGALIHVQHTCDGVESSPPLTISGTPAGAKSLALIVEDIDVPTSLKPDGVFVHWVVFNIPASITDITEGAQVGTLGGNSSGKPAYAGPCPPRDLQPAQHRYVFTMYALDIMLSLDKGAAKGQVMKAMQGHILGQTQLVGKYERVKSK